LKNCGFFGARLDQNIGLSEVFSFPCGRVADTAVPISPCGAFCQVLAEFGVPLVILANRNERVEFLLEELLPRASAGILDRPE
jgi:cytidine deaminase